MRTRTARPSTDRHSLAIGLALSVVIHIVILTGIGFDVAVESGTTDPVRRRRPEAAGRMRVLDLRVADEPVRIPDETRPDAMQVVAGPTEILRPQPHAPARLEPGRPDPVSYLPRFSDARLWTANGAPDAPVDSLETVRERIRSGIASYRSARGMSPDAPQVGPLRYCGGSQSSAGCGLASAYPGRNREFEQRSRIFAEISAQRDRFELDALLKERSGAIRSRAEARQDSTRRN
jgi:hypothetical protein